MIPTRTLNIPAWMLGLLLSYGLPCMAQPVPAAPQVQVSTLELPFQFSLDDFFQQAEELVPAQTGHWRQWRDWHGLDTRYQAWRGPLSMHFQGDTLLIQAHVRYWVQVRKRLIAGLAPAMDCGVDEPARQAIVGLQVQLGWNPDWTPRPQFRVLPTRFIDRCEMSLADIDISPLVGTVFRQQMQRSLRQALDTLGPSMRSIRAHALEAWALLNKPVLLGSTTQLHLRPVGASLSPVSGHGNQARVHLGLALFPQLAPPQDNPTPASPLPALRPYYPSHSGLRFELNMNLDYADLSRIITRLLQGREYTLEKRRFGIGSVQLGAADEGLNIRLKLTGQAEGKVDIQAKPGFDTHSQTFQLEELDYVFEPVDDDLYLLANLFYEKIRQALIEGANEILRSELETAGGHLAATLKRIAPADTVVSMDRIHLSRAGISFTDTGLRLSGTAAGAISLESR